MVKNLRKGQLLYFFQPSEGRLWLLNFQCGLPGTPVLKGSKLSPIPGIDDYDSPRDYPCWNVIHINIQLSPIVGQP